VLTQGNIKVSGGGAAAPPAGEPQVIALDPVLAATAVPGVPQTLTATVYDGAGNPIEGAALSLLSGNPLVGVSPLAVATDKDGRLRFTLVAPIGLEVEVSGLAGGLSSNPVQLTWK
jgi:hypothetical protein